jgi:hypothetical protein
VTEKIALRTGPIQFRPRIDCRNIVELAPGFIADPPSMASFSFSAHEWPGRELYHGRWRPGCVGDDGLYRTLERDFTEEAEISIPQWPHIHDRLTIFRKNP